MQEDSQERLSNAVTGGSAEQSCTLEIRVEVLFRATRLWGLNGEGGINKGSCSSGSGQLRAEVLSR